MDDDLAALARCVGDVNAFARDHWGRQPLLRRAAGPFDDLLDLDAIERLLVATARRPTFRLVRDGTPLPVDEYTTTVRLGGAGVDDAADVARIGALVAGGATLVLQGLQRTWLPLMQFCRALERATSHPVQANAYLTPPGTAGLGSHRDGHEVLVLQVVGSKGWTVDGLDDLELAAGDVLYLPTGTAHAAAAQDQMSLHLTVGLLRDTYRHVLRRALDAAVPDETLDRPLPLGYARPDRAAAFAEGLADVVADAAKHLGELDVDELAAAEVDRAVRRRRPLRRNHLRSVLALASLDDATVVRRCHDNPARLELGDDDDPRVVLRLADRTLRLPAHTRPALELLLAQEETTVRQLLGLDEAGRAVLARRLVLEGLLEIVS